MRDIEKLIHDGHPIQIKSDELPWLKIQTGIDCKVLYTNPESGHWSILQRARAGTILPYHLHHAPSMFWVLEGSGKFPDGEYGPGDYFFEPPAAYHDATTFVTESIVLFHSYGGVTFFDDDKKTPLYHLNHKFLDRLVEEHQQQTA